MRMNPLICRLPALRYLHFWLKTSLRVVLSPLSVQRLLQLGVTPVVTSDPPAPPPTRDQHCNTLPARPDSLILGAPINHKEVERQEEEFDQEEVGEEATESTDTERSVEGSSGTDSRKQSYGELEGTYSSELAKEEPAAVSLEFGVARMTCWDQAGGDCGISRDGSNWVRGLIESVCVAREKVVLYLITRWLGNGPKWSIGSEWSCMCV